MRAVSYLVLARKWRPQTFTDLVGQDHVRRTLENAIAQGRVAHAFLFTGVRGVGKTTSARILAKALSCEQGPTASPCLTCSACLEIAAGSDTDCQEIDGASYNGVDEVRRLQEALPYRPQRDRFKIFIVDEVHMLSNAAWNAFLKTLEEPPPHVKFIFATTEVHKVPVTILSRCQRYDFKMIGAQTIGARLRHVLAAEGIDADDAAIQLVAREARGSMRDAMSLLDQAIAWGGTTLRGEEVATVLGVASRRVLVALAQSVLRGDPRDALERVASLVDHGYDLTHVTRDLLGVFRDLVVSKVAPDSVALLEVTADERATLAGVVQEASADDLVRIHQGFSRGYDDIVRSGVPRGALEMALVRLAHRPALLPVDALLAKLADVERRLGGGGGGPSAGPGGGRPGAPPERPVGGSGAPGAMGGGARASSPPTRAAVQLPGGRSSEAAAPARLRLTSLESGEPDAPSMAASGAGVGVEGASRVVGPPPSQRPAPRDDAASGMPGGAPSRVVGPPPSQRPAPHDVAVPSARTPASGPLRAQPLEPLPPTPPGVDVPLLAGFVDAARRHNQALASVIERTSPRVVSRAAIELALVPGSFEESQLASDEGRRVLEQAALAALGVVVPISFVQDEDAARGFSLARHLAKEEADRKSALVARASTHPLVKAVVDQLGARVVDVRLSGDHGSRLARGARAGKV